MSVPDLTGMSATNTVRWLQFHNRLFGFNGRNRMRAMDGTVWTNAGIDRSNFTPTATLGSTGISGTYRYFVVPCNSKKLNVQGFPVEAIPSQISAEVVPVNQTVTITNIPATHPDSQVDSWNIYRNKDGVYDTDLEDDQQDFFLVGSVDIGTTTFDDNFSDDTLTGARRLRFDQNIPPTFKYGAVFGERVFGVGFDPISDGTATAASATITFTGVTLDDGVVGAWFKKDDDSTIYRIIARPTNATVTLDRNFVGSLSGDTYTIFRYPWEIYFSEFEDAEAWGPDGEGTRNKLEVPGHRTITGIMPYQGNLLVFTAHDIYQIVGKGPNRLDVQMLPDPMYRGLGCVSGDAICLADNECHFLSARGPAKLAGGTPELYGIQLNTDWLDPLTAVEKAIATCGTDDENVWYSVPVSGQTENSKTFRYERATQSWWEETEMCPRLFVREDGDNGETNVLYYTQDRLIVRPNYGTLDLVSAALSETIDYVSTTSVLTHHAGAFPTTGAGLEQCYVRFYRAGVLVGTRRITSNTSTTLTWSSDTSMPGGGPLTTQNGDTCEIGNIGWQWLTKSIDLSDKLMKIQDAYVMFDARSSTQTLQKYDKIDQVEKSQAHNVSAKVLLSRFDVGKAEFDYAARLASRTGATIKRCVVTAQGEAENK